MQTFLPYSNFRQTAKCLDYRRLGKQRVEAHTILKILKENRVTGGWVHHPAVKMWKNNVSALQLYYNNILEEWIRRGYKNTMRFEQIDFPLNFPKWLGDEKFHASHRSNLLRKDKKYYSKFKWKEKKTMPYIWPKD